MKLCYLLTLCRFWKMIDFEWNVVDNGNENKTNVFRIEGCT